MAFAQRIAPQTPATLAGEIFLVTGGTDRSGREAWYYVQVPALKAAQFRKALQTGAVKLTEFGTILLSGFGAAPTQKAKDRIKLDYRFEA